MLLTSSYIQSSLTVLKRIPPLCLFIYLYIFDCISYEKHAIISVGRQGYILYGTFNGLQT